MKTLPLILAGGALAAAFSVSAHAGQTTRTAPGFYGVIGYSQLQPKNDIGSLGGSTSLHINHDARASLALGYRFDAHWSAEAWVPVSQFQHRVDMHGTTVATVKHRPLLLTAQYHYRVGSRVQPYFGFGYGFVSVGSEQTQGPLAGSTLKIKNGDGITAQLGVDVLASPHLFVRAEARYLRWSSQVSLDGSSAGKVTVTPWIYSIGVGYRF